MHKMAKGEFGMKKNSWIVLLAFAFALIPVFALADALVLPQNLKTVEEEAFQGDTSLDGVILPEGLEMIGDRAFEGSSVTSIQIPAGVSAIGIGAFANCTSLNNVYFAGTQEAWAALSAGSGIDALSGVTVYCLSGAAVVDHGSCGSSLFWQLDADGLLTISGSGDMTDYNYSNPSPWNERQIRSVLMLPGVTSVGDYAFYDYSSTIASVTLPYTLTEIGRSAFLGNKQLTAIDLPAALTRIDDWAFESSGLYEIYIPEHVTYIGNEAFANCYSLNSFTVSESNGRFCSDGAALFNRQGTEFLQLAGAFSGVYTVPDGVTAIMNDAFSGCMDLTEVLIPGSVTDISENAFSNIFSLSKITVSADNAAYRSVDGILYNADGSKLLRCPEGKRELCTIPDGVTSIQHSAFANSRIIGVVIPDSVVDIGFSAFAACNYLTSIALPPCITEIADQMLWGCTSLSEVTIPASVTAIGREAFGICNGLKKVVFLGTEAQWGEINIMDGNDSLGSAVLRTADMVNKCGANLTWVLSADGILTISGTGDMYSLTSTDESLWEASAVLSVVIEEGVTTVGARAFYQCQNIASVSLPDGLQSIGDSAFYRCTALTEISIPDSVVTIGNRAFCLCGELTAVSLPDSLISLGAEAFYGCMSLAEVHFGPNIEAIGEYAFYFCMSLSQIDFPDGIRSIGNYAFYNCSDITQVSFPSGLTSIGASAFRGCSSLTGLALPNALTSIDSYAFYGCSAVTEISLPSGLTSIGDYAFGLCSGVTEIVIPAATSSIGSSAFQGCALLETVRVADGNTAYRCADGCLIDIANSSLIWCLMGKTGACTVPEGVATICSYAFSDCLGVTEIYLPHSLRTIEARAFSGCAGLESIVIPDGTLSVGIYAFSGCKALKEITFPGSVTSIGPNVLYNCTSLEKIYCLKDSYAYNWFGGSSLLVEYVGYDPADTDDFTFEAIDGSTCRITGYTGDGGNISTPQYSPDGLLVTAIGPSVFSNSASRDLLTGIRISDGVTEIDEKAFYYCNGLSHVTLPGTLTSIGAYAFSHCKELTGFTIPDGVKIIGDYAFQTSWRLNSVRLPEGLTSIGRNAFDGCTNLKSVAIPQTVEEIGKYAFNYCVSLMSFTFPASLTQISENTLTGCSGLQEIIIPEGVTAIGGSAFYKCTGFTSVSLPSTLTSMGGWCFAYCSALTEIVIPESVTEMGDDIFYACSSLRSAALPQNIKEVRGFDLCTSLASLNYAKDVTLIDLYDCEALTGIQIPNTVTSLNLRNCSGITGVSLPFGCNQIEDSTFSGCEKLEWVYIPATVTKIGQFAFSSCTSLKQIDLPDSLTEIGEYAFSNSGLTEIVIPDSVTVLGERVFFDCAQLKSAVLPDTITKIPNYSFFRCARLMDVDFPDSVTEIGGSAFAYCSSLAEIELPDSLRIIWIEAFRSCTSLRKIVFADQSDRLPGYRTNYSIYGKAFYGCESLTNVFLTPECIEISGEAFKNCTNLICFSALGVNEVGSRAFENCVHLKYLYLKSYMMNGIQMDLVNNCSSLEYMELPTQYRYNDLSGTFSACANLKAVKISSAVTSIASGYFDSCPNLQWIYCERDTYVWNWALQNGYTPMEGSWSYDGQEADDYLVGAFANETINMKQGQTVRLLGAVSSSSKDIGRIALTVDGFEGEYASWQYHGVESASLENEDAFLVNGTIVPFNTPGEYTVRLWAYKEGSQSGQMLDTVQINVEERTKLGVPTITYPAEDGADVAFDNIIVTWEAVPDAAYYVVSMRELDTDKLLIYHDHVTDALETVLPCAYFNDGMQYRIAVGAVPEGFESTASAVVGWCERVFNIPQLPPGSANMQGSVQELATKEAVAKAMRAVSRGTPLPDYIEKSPMFNATVKVYEKSNTDTPVYTTASLDDGSWKTPNVFTEGNVYFLVFEKEGYQFITDRFTYKASAGDNMIMTVYAYDKDMAGVEQAIIDLGYNGIELQDRGQGLRAEFFTSMGLNVLSDKNKAIKNKRAEITVSNLNFSFDHKDEQTTYLLNKGPERINQLLIYDYADTGKAPTTVYYVPSTFSAVFSGYLIVDGTDETGSVKHDHLKIRARSKGNVQLTMRNNDYNQKPATKAFFSDSAELSFKDVRAGTAYEILVCYQGSNKNLCLEYSFDEGATWNTVPASWFRIGDRQVTVGDQIRLGINYNIMADKVNQKIYDKYMALDPVNIIKESIDTILDADQNVFGLDSPKADKNFKLINFASDLINVEVDGAWGSFEKTGEVERRVNTLAARLAFRYFQGSIPSSSYSTDHIWQIVWASACNRYSESQYSVGHPKPGYTSMQELAVLIAFMLEHNDRTGADELYQMAGQLDEYAKKADVGFEPLQTVADFVWDGVNSYVKGLPEKFTEMPGLTAVVNFAVEGRKIFKVIQDDGDATRALIMLTIDEQGMGWLETSEDVFKNVKAEWFYLFYDTDKLLLTRDGIQTSLNGHTTAVLKSFLADMQGESLEMILYKELFAAVLDASIKELKMEMTNGINETIKPRD